MYWREPMVPIFRKQFLGLNNWNRGGSILENWGSGKKKYIEEGGFIYDKIFVYADEQSDKERFFELMEDHFAVIDRGGNTYELAQKSFSKATACEYMVQKFGADREDVYVFGDSMMMVDV